LHDAERLEQQDEGDPRPDRVPLLTSKTSLAGAAHQYKVAEGTTPSLTQGRCGAVEDEPGGGVWAAVELPDPEGVRRPDGAQVCVPVAAVIQATDPSRAHAPRNGVVDEMRFTTSTRSARAPARGAAPRQTSTAASAVVGRTFEGLAVRP
jgi:hypothetical protein